MTDASKEAAWDALMDYQQADEEGVMVLVSRQAIHECKDERDALRAQLQAARDETLEEAAQVVCNDETHPGMPYDDYGDMIADTSERHAQNVTNLALWNSAAEIRALKSTSAEGLKVKPLVWSHTDERTGRIYGLAEHYSAAAFSTDGIGANGLPMSGAPVQYRIWPKKPTQNQVRRNMLGQRFSIDFAGVTILHIENASIEEAKAAAQADYEARIKAALED